MSARSMNALGAALRAGTIAGIASAAAAAIAARVEGQSPAAPINAVSHWLFGDKAAAQDAASARYTLTGLLTNYAACVFWAACYETVRRIAPPTRLGAIASSAGVTAAAYVVDYQVVPRRLTPGYELRLSAGSLALIYAAIALSLPLRDLVRGAAPRS